ncbi:MAG: SpoIID/LytB domain-containing protein [Ruminococcus sp.]|nr:SpoIID/LytB domain-containing protein [Ruminococcus sp.]
MKGQLQVMAVFAVFLITLPMIALIKPRSVSSEPAEAEVSETLLFFDEDKQETIPLPMREYIIGAVAAQMPADFEQEALKAQAVLAHTYALRRIREEELSPTPELGGAHISSNSSVYQAYFDESSRRELLGDGYSELSKKLELAADYALSRWLTFEGEPIIAAFHAVSSGRTESAQEAWGENIPYLVSVESPLDLESPLCLSEITLTEAELKDRLSGIFPEMTSDDITVKVTERSSAGSALTVLLGENSYVSGRVFAAALGLPSACFEVTAGEGSCTFTCKGRGHLLGMSQTGAELMAEEGSSCEEILSHYFPDALLKCSERVG